MSWLVLLLGCHPPSPEHWNGCLYDHADPAIDPDFGLVPLDGEGSVLWMGVRWGGFPLLITDQEHSLELLVAFPTPPEARSYALADLQSRISAFYDHPVDGTVELVALREDHAIVDLDIVYADDHEVIQHVSGRTRVPRGIGAGCRPLGPAPGSVVWFGCQNANVALGHPEATIRSCAEMPHLPGVFRVQLHDPVVSRVVVTDAEGAVETRKGPAAASELLVRARVERRSDLTMNELVIALDALGGLPDGFAPEAMDTNVPDVGRSSLSTTPFRLALIRQLPGPQGGGDVRPEFERATLSRGAAGWRWVIERRSEGTWVPQGELALRR